MGVSVELNLDELASGATGHAVLGPVIVTEQMRPGDVAEIYMDRASGAVRCRRWPGSPGVGVLGWTWTCMVCGEDRPDAQISVAYHRVAGLEQMFPDTRVNVRYCSDRPDCMGKAASSNSVWNPGQLGGGQNADGDQDG
jgi:hypothetical protein